MLDHLTEEQRPAIAKRLNAAYALEDYSATGEIIRNRSIIDGLAVRSQTSSFGLKGKFRDVHDAGRQLRADYILEGSVLRAGPRLRIAVQLICVRDDFPLWPGRYDRLVTDVFAIQDDISLGIVNNLRLKLGQGRRRYETSVDAYDLYLQARAMPNQRARDRAVEAAGIYRQVIAKDPLFAPAYGTRCTRHGLRTRCALGAKREELPACPRTGAELYPELIDYAFWLLLPLGRTEEAVKMMRQGKKSIRFRPDFRKCWGWC